MITQKELKEIINYNRDTGVFTWKIQGSGIKTKFAGGINSIGYVRIKINGKSYLGHRLAWLYEYGKFPIGSLDHINHDRADNRIENLREVNTKENAQNCKRRSNNTSGCTGVYWVKLKNLWKATIKVDQCEILLGYFHKFSDAVNTRKNAEVLYGFHENHDMIRED